MCCQFFNFNPKCTGYICSFLPGTTKYLYLLSICHSTSPAIANDVKNNNILSGTGRKRRVLPPSLSCHQAPFHRHAYSVIVDDVDVPEYSNNDAWSWNPISTSCRKRGACRRSNHTDRNFSPYRLSATHGYLSTAEKAVSICKDF